MGLWIGVAVLAAVLVWLFTPRRRPMPDAEYEVKTAIDQGELAEAERELAEDPLPRSLEPGVDDQEDDWGPGTTR